MKHKIIIILLFANMLLYSAEVRNWTTEENKAETLFDNGKYEEAIILFREIIMSSGNEKIKQESYFWLAKAYMNLEKYDLSETNLELYLSKYKDKGLNYEEALYQKGRLLFLQEQYQSSIEQLNAFIEKYPKSDYVSNAYYWIGECLYALGQFDDSIFYFNLVIEKYVNSQKREAALYKLRLIEHKKSELALQNLLKWSQEQYISSLSQFKIREKTLQQAIDEYEKNKTSSSADVQTINRLVKENDDFKLKIESLQKTIVTLENNINDKTLADKLKQLQMREELLNQKEETLKLYDKQLKEKEKNLAN